MTINVHKGFNVFNRRHILPELRDAVNTLSADMVFLQEVLGEHKKHAFRFRDWPEVPQYEYLADTLWHDYAYGRNAVYPEGNHGNALLSRYPILQYDNRDVSIHGTEKRGLLHCQLGIPGHQGVHAVCVHLGLRQGHRRKQLRLLCELLESLPAQDPVIVAGDFNDWRQQADTILAERSQPTGRYCGSTASMCVTPTFGSPGHSIASHGRIFPITFPYSQRYACDIPVEGRQPGRAADQWRRILPCSIRFDPCRTPG